MGWWTSVPAPLLTGHLEDNERVLATAPLRGPHVPEAGYGDGRRELRGRMVAVATDRRLVAFRANGLGRATALDAAVLYAELAEVRAGVEVDQGRTTALPIVLVDRDGAEVLVESPSPDRGRRLVAHVNQRLADLADATEPAR